MAKTKISEELLELIHDVVANTNGISTSDIAEALNISPTSAYAGVKQLEKHGHITRAAGYHYNKQGKEVHTEELWFHEK